MLDQLNPSRRACGALLGFAVGDALGAQVEFLPAEKIREDYPNGVREMLPGGPHHLLAGQVTDDTEMMITLARSMLPARHYDSHSAARAYVAWCSSGVPGIGPTIRAACGESLDPEDRIPGATLAARARERSKHALGTGALMRCAPIGLVGYASHLDSVIAWADEDAKLTHPHPSCLDASRAYTSLLAFLTNGMPPREAVRCASDVVLTADGILTLSRAWDRYPTQQDVALVGTALVALHTAVRALVRSTEDELSFEDLIVDVVNQGGDTDTHAALAGALLGAHLGFTVIPTRWVSAVVSCPSTRPLDYRPHDLPNLATRLVSR